MKRQLLLQSQQIQLLFFLFILFFTTACKEDKGPNEEKMKSESYYEGEIRFEHFDQKTVPGVYECYFTNQEDHSEVIVAAIVYSEDGDVVFIPEMPISVGAYYFNRAVAVETDKKEDAELIGQDVALGCKVSFSSTEFTLERGSMDPLLACYGTGTKDDPFRISSYVHLDNLMDVINSSEENNRKYRDKYYMQTANLSLTIPCTNLNNGWNSIGNSISRPFAGHYDGQKHTIKNMYIKRTGNIVPQPAGLFGIVVNATIKNLKLDTCEINSDYPVAGLLIGSVVSTGSDQLTSSVTNCIVKSSCTLKAPYLAGGLIGGVNQFARLIMTGCENNMSITCNYPGVGGLIGASFLTSSVTLDKCKNSAKMTNHRGIVGGLIGSADTLLINNCTNTGAITGGSGSIGTGGLVGGGTNVVASYCSNSGKVIGGREVGGILGSAARHSSEKIYGDVHIYTSSNEGYIEGTSEVGGLVGSAQIMISGSYNFNQVRATGKNVGGLAGLGPIAVIINSTNDGNVISSGNEEDNYVGGILGSAQDYTLTACNNYGNVSAEGSGTVGGLLGGCDMLGSLSYCGNFGAVKATKGSVGGIIGRAGKPKNMSDKMIADMVLGTALSIASIGMSGAEMANGKKQVAKMVKVNQQLDIAAKVLNSFILINDIAWTTANNILPGSTLTREKLEILQTEKSADLQKAHTNKISTMTWNDPNLNLTDIVNKQQELQASFVDRLAQNTTVYNDNIEKWRNDVEEKMHAAEKRREVASHVGEGISFAGDIIGYCPVPNPLSIVVTAVIALYNLVMNLTDFSYNRVGIIQCYNYGAVTAPSGQYGGGIAGELHDYARIYNSANFGKLNGEQIGMLIGLGGHLPEVSHSINFVEKKPLYYSCKFPEEIKHNVNNGYMNAFENNTYKKNGFDLTKAWMWQDNNNLPLIYKSQFE